jgi:hypothetical protein
MNIGKKILSAFVEVSQESKQVTKTAALPAIPAAMTYQHNADGGKFRQYFDKLFAEANKSGPDYYEFTKMIEVMNAIADEKARYMAAFAGLSAQGLDRTKLLSTASEYLELLDSDASNFNNTIAAALQEKVLGKQQEIEEKSKRIQQLSQEITELHNKIAVLQSEIKENEDKIQNSSNGYRTELDNLKNRIITDIEKIKQHIN